jgi:hypothetical protein
LFTNEGRRYVQATDNPTDSEENARSSQAPVVFTVLDNNDHFPEFEQPNGYATSVAENAKDAVFETVVVSNSTNSLDLS